MICLLQNHDLARLVKIKIKELKTSQPVYRRDLVCYGGIQEGSDIMVINPEQVIDLNAGKLTDIHETSFVCIGKRQGHMERNIQEPTGVEPLGNFLDMGLHVLGKKTFGVAILAWCAMYTLNVYGWVVSNLRHFNLPVVFGEPMVGKSLIASCAAWLNGCPRTAIVSRSTLSYVTSMVTGSTMPFIWDDPSTPNEVSQLAIDLGNSAVRGKISQDTQLPRTGCLVTANFDMSEMLKYFSRIVVLLVEGSGKTKVAGEAMLLEEEAKKASASFPLVMKQLNSLQIENIHHEYRLLREQLPTDIRILEGIAVNLHVTRQILNLAGRYHYLPYVQHYIRQTMVPYYKKQLVDVPMVTPVTTVEFDLSDAINIAMLNPQNAMIMKGGTILALDPRALCKDISHAAGVTYNKATKFQGKTKKMIQIRTDVLDEDCLKTISERTRKQTLTAADTKTQETNQQQPPLPLPEHQPPSPEPMQPQTREVLQQPTPEVLQQPTPEAPQSPTPKAPQSPTPEAPQSQTPEAPQSQTPEAPRSPTPEAPQSPTPEAPQSPTPEAPQSPTPEAPQSPTPEAPQSPTLEAPQSPTPDAPQSPTPEAQQQPTPKQLPSVQNRRRKRIWLPTPIQSSAPEDPITCNKCNKIGREGRLWVQCEKCDRWYHSSCQGIASKRHRSVEFQKNPWMCC